jgi:hypothetical protein
METELKSCAGEKEPGAKKKKSSSARELQVVLQLKFLGVSRFIFRRGDEN